MPPGAVNGVRHMDVEEPLTVCTPQKPSAGGTQLTTILCPPPLFQSGGNDFKTRGMVPRALAQVFNDIVEKPEQSFEIRVSYMEIYNDRIYDLLAEPGLANADELQIQEDSKGLVMVLGWAGEEPKNMPERIWRNGEASKGPPDSLLGTGFVECSFYADEWLFSFKRQIFRTSC